jgi:hypothetical protein
VAPEYIEPVPVFTTVTAPPLRLSLMVLLLRAWLALLVPLPLMAKTMVPGVGEPVSGPAVRIDWAPLPMVTA